ncbi:Membrane-bound lytic murein transglycosylase C precursor [Raoultella ornithinolytica]|nr:Membrane-bound lytic murein transglycosylase C precursor [Raoultella ornithinolytica]
MISRSRKSRSCTARWWITTAIRFRWEWRASRYADYLLQTRLKSRSNGLRMIYSITINLVPNHLDKRAHKYIGYVRQSARKYGVDESLILAIMQTESSFNPYAREPC